MNDEEERRERAQKIFCMAQGISKFRTHVLVAAMEALRDLTEKELSVAEIAFVGKLLADPSQWHVVLQAKDDAEEKGGE